MKVLQPKGWAPPRGYANGVAASGTMVFVAGQIGWNEQSHFDSDDLLAQARQALLNVRAVLAEAGARPEHMVRMTWYVIDSVTISRAAARSAPSTAKSSATTAWR